MSVLGTCSAWWGGKVLECLMQKFVKEDKTVEDFTCLFQLKSVNWEVYYSSKQFSSL